MKSLAITYRLALILLPWCAGTTCAGPSTDEIARAIKQLGDPGFAVREQATAFLWRAGEAAEPALRAALKSPDPEVVQRARRVLQRLRWGIFADTPAEVVALIRQYQHGDQNAQRQAVKQLLTRGRHGSRTLRCFLAHQKGIPRNTLVSLLEQEAEQAMPSLIAAEMYDIVENLLELLAASGDPQAIRNYVACLMLRRRVEDRIAAYLPRANGVEAKRMAGLLACLYRAKGDLDTAADWAEKADVTELTDTVLYLARRWKVLAARHAGKHEGEEALGFQLTYQRLAGQTHEVPATLTALRRLATSKKPDDGSIWWAAKPLFLNDFTEEALAVLARSPHQQMSCDVLTAQLRFRAALNLMESTARVKGPYSFTAEVRCARILSELGETQQARALARRLRQVPRHQLTEWDFRCLIELLRHLGDTEAAFDQLALWFETDPRKSESWAWLAVFPERGDEAESWSRVFRRRAPMNRPDRRIQAVRRLLEGDRSELDTLIHEALPLCARLTAYEKEYFLLALAKTCKAARRPDLRRKCLEHAAVQLKSAQAWRLLADDEASARRWRQAAQHYHRAALADPKDLVYLALQGWALVQAGQGKEGERLCRRASWLALGQVAPRYKMAEEFEKRGLIDEARRQRTMIYRLALSREWELGGVLSTAEAEALAGKDFCRAADLNEMGLLRVIHSGFFFREDSAFVTAPHEVHFYRARGLLNAGKVEEALAEARICQKLLPGDVELPITLVPALEKRGRHQDAEKLFQQVYRLYEGLCKQYPRWATGHHQLAVLCSDCRRRLEEGQQYAEKAVALAPRKASYLATLAEIHFQRGHQRKAVALLTRCRELDPANAAYRQKLERFKKPRFSTAPAPPVRSGPVLAAPAPRPAPPKPLRILLFAGSPSREYQFLRMILLRRAGKGELKLATHLQKGRRPGIVMDVPPDDILEQFPTRLVAREKASAEGPDSNLARYDLLIAVDPDWTLLTQKQLQMVEKWARERRHGLIYVAGPVNTESLGRPALARKLEPILDILPVRIGGPRRKAAADRPCRLGFPEPGRFLELEADAEPALAGWSQFFFDQKRGDWQKTDDRPVRGFFSRGSVEAVKPAATVLAVFHDPDAPARARDVPYLVSMPCGKGRTVYLGSSETWRLRAFREEYHERFWAQMIRHAVSTRPGKGGKLSAGGKTQR